MIDRLDRFASFRLSHDDLATVEFVEVERMQRLTAFEHHIVGGIHHVVDAVHADRGPTRRPSTEGSDQL